MKKFMWAIMCSAAVVAPAFAQDAGMAANSITCAEFLAMDSGGRTKAVESVQMASAEGDMASGDMASDDMASDDMASDDMASDDMASGEMMESDQMASGDAMMAEDTVAAVQEVCERDPSIRLADAVEEAAGH